MEYNAHIKAWIKFGCTYDFFRWLGYHVMNNGGVIYP